MLIQLFALLQLSLYLLLAFPLIFKFILMPFKVQAVSLSIKSAFTKQLYWLGKVGQGRSEVLK